MVISRSDSSDQDDVGAPLPDFRVSNIQLQTIAPALGPSAIQQTRQLRATPDYLEYDTGLNGGRGFTVTMFANTGLSYLIGIGGGGLYGIRHGLAATPSQRFRVQLNSVLNHSGRYGSRLGNTLGVFSILYSIYEYTFDYLDIEERIGLRKYGSEATFVSSFISPALSAAATGATYYSTSGFRVAGLAGSIGFGTVFVTYTTYSLLGIPYGSYGYLFL